MRCKRKFTWRLFSDLWISKFSIDDQTNSTRRATKTSFSFRWFSSTSVHLLLLRLKKKSLSLSCSRSRPSLCHSLCQTCSFSSIRSDSLFIWRRILIVQILVLISLWRIFFPMNNVYPCWILFELVHLAVNTFWNRKNLFFSTLDIDDFSVPHSILNTHTHKEINTKFHLSVSSFVLIIFFEFSSNDIFALVKRWWPHVLVRSVILQHLF